MKAGLSLIALALATTASFHAFHAFACSSPVLPPMTEDQKRAYSERIDREFVDHAKSATAILEAVALSTAGDNISRGDLLITEVLRGQARRGRVIRMKTIGTSLCGAGGFSKNERGIFILTGDKLFSGFLSERSISLLRKEKVIP